MRINHNISALQTNGNLRRTGNSMDKAMEKLSSGYKINRAADDAAGMAISRKMRTQIDGLSRASMNGSDGISVIQTAEGALNEVTSILQRCRELAVQAANDVNTTDDRMAIKREIDELKKEINRISETTEFNTKTLLDGNLDNNKYTDNPGVTMIYNSDSVAADQYGINVIRDPRQAILNCGEVNLPGNIIDSTRTGTITINGMSVKIEEGDTLEKCFSKLRDTCDIMDIDVFFGDGPDVDKVKERAGYEVSDQIGQGSLVFMSRNFGSEQKIDLQCSNPTLAASFGMSTGTVSTHGLDAKVELLTPEGEGFSKTATAICNGDIVTVKDSGGFEMRLRVEPGLSENPYIDGTGNGVPGYYYSTESKQAEITGQINVSETAIPFIQNNTGNNLYVRIQNSDGYFDVRFNTESVGEYCEKIKNACAAHGIEVDWKGPSQNGIGEYVPGEITFTNKYFGNAETLRITSNSSELSSFLGLPTSTTSRGIDAEVTYTTTGTQNVSLFTDKNDGEAYLIVDKNVSYLSDPNVKVEKRLSVEEKVQATVLDAGTMFLQIGANENQTMEVKIPRIDSETLNIDNVNVITHEGAEKAITTFDNAVNFISQIRSKLGAYQNRLEHTIENLETANTNMTEAMSRIEDTDMAEEMTTFTQQNVLQQAGTAMLSQANQRPQQILSLLNG